MAKKIFLGALILILLISAAFSYSQAIKRVVVYDDKDGVYVPSGFMGDANAVKLDNRCTERPHSGTYCQKWTYDVTKSQNDKWAGVYWQYPPNNWGKKKGYDLRGIKKLTFWAKGEKGGECISIKIGGIKEENADALNIEYGKIRLTILWKQYTINLYQYQKDLSSVVGGFCWSVDSNDNPQGCVFYLDDIVYE
ncbi:MAG: hypothetical protein ABH847_00800 [Candidatus Omnitrophota bacterium]